MFNYFWNALNLFVFKLQVDIFQLVGAPLVENCLAGFNSSVFAYGQVLAFSFSFIFVFELLLFCFITFQFVGLNKMISLDWKWKDLYDLGSSQRLVGRKLIKWSTRLNSPCVWATLCLYKWGKSFNLCSTVHQWMPWMFMLWNMNGPFSIVCALTFYFIGSN